MLAWVVLTLPLLAMGVTIGGRSAAGQSPVTLGSALDQPSPGDTLLPTGSFRLDGPSDHPLLSETSGDPHAGTTSLGLQIYGSESGPAPRPADSAAPPAPPRP
jgi:hypothetical protein